MLLFIVTVVVGILIAKLVYNAFLKKVEVHRGGYREEWFGRIPQEGAVDTSIRPFKVNVKEEVLEDLRSRLKNTRYEDPLENCQLRYGFTSQQLRKVVEYWRNEYNWRKQEEELNKYPQFKTRIEGIDVHFLHIKPAIPEGKQVKVIPLIVVHGWPGSILEFYKLIPLLTTVNSERDFVFEVVCPSIPGYGFSEASHQKGLNVRACARIFLTLMERLGHEQFYAQGGDWGSFICSILAKYYPSRVIGVHLNMFATLPQKLDIFKAVVIAYLPFLIPSAEYKLFYPFKEKFFHLLQETGYMHLQSTKPDTIGCAMADSPAGLAAYILEKFVFWTNPSYLDLEDGGLTKKFTLDELLTNVMIYWVNNTFTASVRFYKENIGERAHDKVPITVPCGLAMFPNEILGVPKCLTSVSVKDLVSYNVMPRGGHFAAFEEPQLLADDIHQFVIKVEKRLH